MKGNNNKKTTNNNSKDNNRMVMPMLKCHNEVGIDKNKEVKH